MHHSRIQSWNPLVVSKLSSKAIFFNQQSLALFALFFMIRFGSYLLVDNPIGQAIVVFALIMLLGLVYFRSQEAAWALILTEIFLGGSGHLFEFYGLSLRTILITTFICLWIFFTFSSPDHRDQLRIPHRLFLLCIPLFILVHISAIIGLVHGHHFDFVIQDLIPYVFLFLVLPTYHLFKDTKLQEYFIRLIIIFLIGSAIFSLFTFFAFSLGISELHDPFYQWFRDVAMGKITAITPYFFRIVLPEHLIIAPSAIIILSLLMRNEKHHPMWRILFICCAIILALNMSRAYVLGFAVALLILKYKHKAKEWAKEGLWAIIVLLLVFVGVNTLASRGTDMGLGVLGLRGQSFLNPDVEESSRTRMLLIPPILETIKENPVLGVGLGATIIYTNSTSFTPIETRQFDWGYLEMLAELGPFGLLYFVILLFVILFECFKRVRQYSDYHDLHVGLLAGLVSLMIINITTPALFHVFGILYLVFTTAFVGRSAHGFDFVVTLLYRIFNKSTIS